MTDEQAKSDPRKLQDNILQVLDGQVPKNLSRIAQCSIALSSTGIEIANFFAFRNHPTPTLQSQVSPVSPLGQGTRQQHP